MSCQLATQCGSFILFSRGNQRGRKGKLLIDQFYWSYRITSFSCFEELHLRESACSTSGQQFSPSHLTSAQYWVQYPLEREQLEEGEMHFP